MSYGADFSTADPANAPLDPPIFIGAEPVVWLAVFLLLVAAALLGYFFGVRKRPSQDAASAIWKAVDSAAKDAMKADTEALPAKAAELQRVVQERLGKTLHFGGDLKKWVGDLDKALKGEIEDKTPATPVTTRPGATDVETEAGAGSAAAAAAANVTIVAVHAPTAVAPPPPPPTPPEPTKRAMTNKERNDALRLAVAAFNDYWRHKVAREKDMRAVVAELCNPGPPPPPVHLSHGAHH
jgi:hypothetical protein